MGEKVGIISLGCSKNLVDTELMLGILEQAGYSITGREHEADVLIVNTCGFITPAKEEAINTIFEMNRYKNSGRCRVLLVAGCLSQRYGRLLLEEMPEIDGIIGTGAIPQIASLVDSALEGERIFAVGEPGYEYTAGLPRVLSTPPYMAYVKIAEGCSNKCAYCAIPGIRGPYRSRSMESIEAEVIQLAERGVQEVILVAQDTTRYGLDIYGEFMLSTLLSRLSHQAGPPWIRVLYCYPTGFTGELIKVIAQENKICKYIDLPLQHISDPVLSRMNRRGKSRDIRKLINELRINIPNLTLRTTFIVGFPGETETDFQELLDFMEDVKFNHAGVFKYSPEEGTTAMGMPDQVPEEIKEERLHRAMSLQKKISLEKNRSRVGRKVKVLVEGQAGNGKDLYIGRSQGDAPDIDGLVYFKPGECRPFSGQFVNVLIQRALEYDVIGELVP